MGADIGVGVTVGFWDHLRLLGLRVLGESRTDPRGLLLPGFHDPIIESQRAGLLISRVRLVAAMFAFLTPLWVFVDTLFLPIEIWPKLASGRIAATVAFVVLSLLYRKSDRLLHAYLALAALFLIPTAFFGYSHLLFSWHPYETTSFFSVSLLAGYAFLPFVIAAGLSVFPLTMLEGFLFSLPVFAVQLLAGMYGVVFFGDGMQVGLMWLLALIVAIAILSGMSQLHFLSEIIIKASHDPLTGAFTRPTGEELLAKYYAFAHRNGTPLTLVFVDLDHFKSVNDLYGHEAGDAILQGAARRMLQTIRREDLLIRWGGEEFLLVLPYSSTGDPLSIVHRLATRGLGQRPDGAPLTASLGLAELQHDGVSELAGLIRLSDERMYRAKHGGRNRVCYAKEGEERMEGPLFRATVAAAGGPAAVPLTERRKSYGPGPDAPPAP